MTLAGSLNFLINSEIISYLLIWHFAEYSFLNCLSVSLLIKYSPAADLKDFSHKETKGGKSILRGWRC